MPYFKYLIVLIAMLNTLPLLIAPASATPRDVSASTSAELRLDYLQKLLHSKSGERLKMHNGGSTYEEVEKLLQDGKQALSKGETDKADQLGKKGLKILMSAAQALPEDPEEIARNKKRYEDFRRGLEKFGYAQEDNKERFSQEAENSDYDKEHVANLLALADQDAQQGDYEKAISRLKEAQTIVTSSLQSILNNKQLVIELDIGTPEKEYYYELRRYMGYEELIPVAIEVKKPAPFVVDKMTELSEKAQWMSEQARDKVIQQDYPVAIRMIMDATDVLRQALKLAGVMM